MNVFLVPSCSETRAPTRNCEQNTLHVYLTFKRLLRNHSWSTKKEMLMS